MLHPPLQQQLDMVQGAAPTVILLHCSGVTGRVWYPYLRALEEKRHAVAPTRLGYGTNPRLRRHSPFSVHDDLELMEQLLLRSSAPVDLVGHSYGGWLALQLASRHPARVRQVIAHEPALWGVLYSAGSASDIAQFEASDAGREMFVAEHACTSPWMKRFIDFWSGDGTWDQLTPRRQRAHLDTGWKTYHEVRHACLDRTPHTTWAALDMPVHLTIGEHSPPLERRVLELLLPWLAHGSLTEVEGGHMAPITHPHGLVPHLLRWLEVSPSRAGTPH